MSRRQGFTLLELCLAVMIGLLLMSIGVPSVTGMLREQRLRATFEEFDDFVRGAQSKAIKERRMVVMVWDKEGISLDSPEVSADEANPAAERFAFVEGATWNLQRPAALVKNPVWEWPFWRSGACEPVTVSYESPAGTWSAEYNGLTGRGKVVAMEVK